MAKRAAKKSKKLEKCEILLILDRSGSMSSIKTDMEGGIATFVKEQAALPGECNMTLVQFDSNGIETVFESKPIAEVGKVTLEPRGATPLLDAVGKTITNHKNKAGKVVLFIVTDGQENASREWKKDGVRKLVQEVTDKGWVVSYLGANVDSFAEAGSIGIGALSTMDYSPTSRGVRSMLATASATLTSYRSGGTFGYTKEDREQAAGL